MSRRRKAAAAPDDLAVESYSKLTERKRVKCDTSGNVVNVDVSPVVSNQRIILNVGGKRFETYASTLRRHPKSALAGIVHADLLSASLIV
jgi:hypothetical protein